MGFSSEAIFVKAELKDEMIQKITELTHGDSDLVFNREIDFDTIASGPPPGIYFGQMNQSFYMIYNYMTQDPYDKRFADVQDIFALLFPETEILYITNIESANAYAYHFIKNGETIRKKVGAHPHVIEDIGEELETEKAYYVKKEIRDGQEIYFTKSYYKEGELDEYTHDQVGGSIAFKLVKDMTGCEYMTSDTDGFMAKEYLSKKRIQEMNDFLEGKSEKKMIPELREGLPISAIKEIIASVSTVLSQNGFKETESGHFLRVHNGLNQEVKFYFNRDAKEYSNFSYNFSQNLGYKAWCKEQFGTDRLPSGQIVHDSIGLNFRALEIQDKHQSLLRSGDKNKQELIDGISERLRDAIIPAFDKSTLESISKTFRGLRKADFHLMRNEIEAARSELENLKETLVTSSIKNNWAEKQKEDYFELMESRNKFFESPIVYREYYKENYERLKIQVEEELQKQKEEQEKARKERELKAKEAEIQAQKEAEIRAQQKAKEAEQKKIEEDLRREKVKKQMAIFQDLQGAEEVIDIPIKKEAKSEEKQIIGDVGVDPKIVEMANEYNGITIKEVRSKLKKLYELPRNQRKPDHATRISVLEAFAKHAGVNNVVEWAKKDAQESSYKTVIVVIAIIIIITLLFMR